MAPHVTAELWEQRHPGRTRACTSRRWPVADPDLVRADDHHDGRAGQRQGPRPPRGRARHRRGRRRGRGGAGGRRDRAPCWPDARPRGSWRDRRDWSTSSSDGPAREPPSADTSSPIEPPRFDRPEVEIRASTRRKKTGTAHWSGSRIVVQIPARLRGRERAAFVDDLVERLLTQRPQNAAGDASLEERAKVLAELYNDGVAARARCAG